MAQGTKSKKRRRRGTRRRRKKAKFPNGDSNKTPFYCDCGRDHRRRKVLQCSFCRVWTHLTCTDDWRRLQPRHIHKCQDCRMADICPWCDEPHDPLTPTLRVQRRELLLLSVKRPTLECPNHAELDFTRHITFCISHRNLVVIRAGILSGYPSIIDFVAVARRVAAHVQSLKPILQEPRSSRHFSRLAGTLPQLPPYDRGVQLMSLAIPGYYGEKGYFIIFEEVTRRLAERELSALSPACEPLTLADVYQCLLIREVGTLLLREDKPDCSDEELDTLMEVSAEFGRSQFPEPGC